MDQVKTAMAKAVQETIISISAIQQIQRNPELHVEEIKMHVISPTETMLRVKTSKHGVRYFNIKFKEMM